MTTKQFSVVGLAVRGMAMGVAEIIPGVSGGTIAFITGIYEQLLMSISAFDLTFVKMLFGGKFQAAWDKINGRFLASLIGGMVLGIVIGVFGVTYLLEQYPEVLWSFFFGCILASVPYIFSQIPRVEVKHVVLFLATAAIAAFICLQKPIAGSTNPLYVILAGSIAISALLLPGVSGSFMLVLLGLYTLIIPSLKQFLTTFEFSYLTILIYFGIGCVIGVLAFSRILTYVYNHYRSGTLAVLSGFMLGSIVKVWPWREPTLVFDKTLNAVRQIENAELTRSLFHSEEIKVVSESFVLPQNYFTEPYLPLSLAAICIGIITVYSLWKYQK